MGAEFNFFLQRGGNASGDGSLGPGPRPGEKGLGGAELVGLRAVVLMTGAALRACQCAGAEAKALKSVP